MLIRWLGRLWMLFGVWWILRPASLKRSFRWKLRSLRFRFAFILLIYAGGIFPAIMEKLPEGWTVRAGIMLLGMVLIRIVLKKTGALSKRLFERWLELPLWFWRIQALLPILLGYFMQAGGDA